MRRACHARRPLPCFLILLRPPPRPTLFPYTTLFRSRAAEASVMGSGTSCSWRSCCFWRSATNCPYIACAVASSVTRSEEHTSELQSRVELRCRLLREKKKIIGGYTYRTPDGRAVWAG